MEEYKIEFLRTALKELAKLPVEIQQRIAVRIEELKFLSPSVNSDMPYPIFVEFCLIEYS